MSQKVDSRAMREVNRSIVLDMIRRSGSISRTDLARLSSLTKPTVGAIVDGLLASGVIHEVGLGKALRGGGRPARLLALNGESAAYAGLSFCVGRVRVAISDATGEIRTVLEAPASHGNPEGWVDSAFSLVRDALEQAGFPGSKLRGVGASVTGVVDAEAGRCVDAPHLGWQDFALGSTLEQRFSVPALISSSCNASAVAERRIGSARGCQSFVWLEVDRAVSAGIVINDQVFQGRGGLSGEIGHFGIGPSGRRLDEVASNLALERAFAVSVQGGCTPPLNGRALLNGRAPVNGRASVREIVRAASIGDAIARDAVQGVCEQLGVAISYVFDLLGPDMVVVGGEIAKGGPFVKEGIERAARGCGLRSTHGEIRLSQLGEDAALRGALFCTMERSVPSFRLVSTTASLGTG